MMGFGMGMMGGGFSLILWIIIIGAVIYFVVNRNNQDNSHYHDYDRGSEIRAEEIARERYAKGEISKEELDKILQDLR